MAVTILFNPGQVDSRQMLVERIKKQLDQGEKRSIFYVVPNHVKFDAEVDVLKRLRAIQGFSAADTYAQSQVQVYSLTRLAWHFLQQQGKIQPPVLGEAGLFVLVSQILKEHAAVLPTFARMQAKRGFVQNLVTQLAELRGAEITPQDLLAILDEVGQNSGQSPLLVQNLSQKLRDLAVVADAFNEALADDYILAQESLPYFVEQSQDLDLSDSILYFEGFTGFTAGEWAVVNLLLRKADVTFAMLGSRGDLRAFQPGDVFEKPLTTALNLMRQAQQAEVDLKLEDGQPASGQAKNVAGAAAETGKQAGPAVRPAILAAWEKLGAYGQLAPAKDKVAMEGFVATNTVAELEAVARKIRQDLQSNPDLHLRDILVLARDLGPYEKHLPAVMNQFDLAYFLDNDIKMGNHPLVELVTKLLGPANQFFQSQNVLTVLKTGFLRPIQAGRLVSDDEYFEIVAYLDNYLAGHRSSARVWHDDQAQFELFQLAGDPDHPSFAHDAQINRRLNYLKAFVTKAFDDVKAGLDRAATLGDGARFLLSFLQKYQVTEAVLQQRDQLIDSGELVKAQQVMEVWQLFVNILDQVVQVAGDQDFDREVFLAALQAGFAGGKFTGIPNQLDQLTVSEAGIVQSQQYKVLYFIGGTRNALPAQVKNKTVLTDQDRLLVQPALADQDQPRYLRQTAAQQMAEENLVFYGALQAASDKVVLSYPLLNQDGRPNEISPYYSRLLNHFGVELETVTGRPENLADLSQNYLGSPSSTLSELVKLTDIAENDPAFVTLKQALNQAGLGDKTDRVLAGRTYFNRAESLEPAVARQLFHLPLRVSISQIETYYKNPYEYFLRYGLALQERPSAELDAAQTGIIYHDLFEKAVQKLIDQQESLRDLDESQAKDFVTAELAKLVAEPEFAKLQEPGQGQAISDYLAEIAEAVLLKLKQGAATNQSRPERVETLFGFPQGDLEALTLAAGDSEVVVRGKIDRFDLQDGQGQYGTLVDYKTREKTFKYGDAWSGLQLQLLTYWQAAQENAAKLGIKSVGGAFFAPITPKTVNLSDFTGEIDDLLAGKEASQTFKYRGLAVNQPDYLDELERLAPKESARYYQLKTKADGQPDSNADVIAPADFDLLTARNRTLLQEAAQQIQAGHFPIRPVQSALTYSPFKDVIRFDKVLGDRYRLPEFTGKNSTVMKKIREQAAKEDDRG